MRIFAGGDPHCGAVTGLVPPKWWQNAQQEEIWECFKTLVTVIGPFDIAIFNADMIAGKQKKQGSTDLITADRREQCQMAKDVIELVNAPVNLLTYGTSYHTGTEEDWEDVLRDMTNGIIKDHHFLEIEGVNVSVKHKLSSSYAPQSRLAGLIREKMWDLIWATEKKQHPRSQLIIRSHVHYHEYCGKKGPDWWLGVSLPALQALGDKFGARQCSGVVDWGFCWFDISKGRIHQWEAEIVDFPFLRNKVLKYTEAA